MNSTIYMFKSIPTEDSQVPEVLGMEFGPQKVECLYLFILFFAYFYFTKICEPLVAFCV